MQGIKGSVKYSYVIRQMLSVILTCNYVTIFCKTK